MFKCPYPLDQHHKTVVGSFLHLLSVHSLAIQVILRFTVQLEDIIGLEEEVEDIMKLDFEEKAS